jgi:hypothetical protein
VLSSSRGGVRVWCSCAGRQVPEPSAGGRRDQAALAGDDPMLSSHRGAGGDTGMAKMWNRREISATSDDDRSRYLHPHPYTWASHGRHTPHSCAYLTAPDGTTVLWLCAQAAHHQELRVGLLLRSINGQPIRGIDYRQVRQTIPMPCVRMLRRYIIMSGRESSRARDGRPPTGRCCRRSDRARDPCA